MIVTRGFGSENIITQGYGASSFPIVAFAEEILRRYRVGGSAFSKKDRPQIFDIVREIAVFARLLLIKEDSTDNVQIIKEIYGTKTLSFDETKLLRVNVSKTSVRSSRNDISVSVKRLK